jgi:hypothetical protein
MRFEDRIVKKYSDPALLETLDKPIEDELILDFTVKFNSMLAWRGQKENPLTFKGFEKQIFALRALWQSAGQQVKMPEPVWRKLYATVIAPLRDEMFPEEMMQRRMANEANGNISQPDETDEQPKEICNRSRTFSEYK